MKGGIAKCRPFCLWNRPLLSNRFIAYICDDSSKDYMKVLQLLLISVTIILFSGCSQTENGYEYVDLGLPSGNLWAVCNVGAEQPYHTGEYYAWGETQPKVTYNWDNYKYSQGDSVMLKYNSYPKSDHYDGLDRLMSDDDVAAVRMGGKWAMPTSAEYEELLLGCDWEEIKDYKGTGASGMLGVSRTNGATIFFPNTGMYYNSELKSDSVSFIWTSDLSDEIYDVVADSSYTIRKVSHSAISIYGIDMYRAYGIPVRGIVRGNNIIAVQLTPEELKMDSLEKSAAFKDVIYDVEEEVIDSMLKNPYRNSEGACHIYWRYKKDILKRYGFDWMSPAELYPDVIFD